MNSPDREPLTPEEQWLADRLASGPTAPSPAVDAAILAAARHAAQDATGPAYAAAPATPVQTTQRRRRRWPVAFGAAASLAVAVGVAWQLRPVPEAPHTAWAEHTEGMQDTAPAVAHDAPSPAAARAPAPRHAPEATPTQDAPQSPQASAAVEAPAVGRTAEAPVSGLPMPDAPQTAGWGPPRESESAATAYGNRVTTAEPASMQHEAAAEADRASTVRPATARAQPQAMAIIDDLPDDDQPPASADAPEVREAWLARVRELLDAGDIGAARASLAEFHRRHPQAELPPDLRALLD
ncbi:hypothetical protein MNO14_07405 [Luteimonas sp. S4-F44]|uniref:hypothetical protein n=1 Tax=Luteimonas sp. S4-F44 TaxID=2925842 RepID=UPI001F536CE1|nr:hypothetical protein [Luteimonas sp. S4-F44]UNK43868.1 hypothetical protein MNO14_07405 [Luteimonas sp. S4-F44]